MIFDCAPSLGSWTPQAIAAATDVCVPLQCEFLSMQGLAQMLHLFEKSRTSIQAGLHILPVMYEEEKPLHKEVVEEVRNLFPESLCKTKIPRDPLFSEASSYGLSLFQHHPRSMGCTAYANLIREVIDGWAQTG